MKRFTFHNIGFSGGNPIFPKAAATKRKKVNGESFKREVPQKICNEFKTTEVKKEQPLPPARWLTAVREIAEESELEFVERRGKSELIGIVTRGVCDEKAMCPLRLVCKASGVFTVEVYFVVKEEGHFKSRECVQNTIQKLFGPGSVNKVCRGLTSYHHQMQNKNLRHWGMPITRIDSRNCELWHKPQNRKRRPDDELYDVCRPCKRLHRSLTESKKRKERSGKSRTRPSSTCNWKFLSPQSSKKRRLAVSKRERKLQRKLRRLETSRCALSEKQDTEMSKIVNIIEEDFATVLEDVIGEGHNASVLRAVWDQDVKDRKDFWTDQRKNRNGKTGNKWSTITYRMALAVFCRSPAAYEALAGFNILQLPSQESLKHIRRAYYQGDGPNWDNLNEAAGDYNKLKEEKRNSGLLEPIGWGVLIADEVKVVTKIQWNSRNNEFVGHSLTADEMVSLHDVYIELDPNQRKMRASYVLQFLWRDMSSEFDVIGPYFKSEAGMKHQFVMTCTLNAIHALHLYGFEVMAIVLDGASTNLAAIKYFTMGKAGAYGMNEDLSADEPHHIKTWFTNPYTGTKIFFIPCPSHELKSVIAALSSSKPTGRKHFNLWGTNFGWRQIIALWNRELDRARRCCMLRVPKLKYRHVFRDAWTRLNVSPAKIMQQDHVIGELKEYAASNPPEADQVSMTVQFLEATQSLFEFGILSHDKILDASSPVLSNMEDGFLFFVAWADYCYGEGNHLATPGQTVFLAWQTWDLLRLMYYGFTEFCQHFFERFPGYYIVPLRINGSAIETIFSQLRFSTSGNLSGSNYGYALSSLTLRRFLHGHQGKFKYRNARLYIRQKNIKRRR